MSRVYISPARMLIFYISGFLSGIGKMAEIVKSKNDFCTGCNRCVRECPMETANITYQDEFKNIKVKIDYEKCIACGRCVSACRHDARYFIDDTELFFADLSAGVPVSIIAAPSIKTNIPEYKKLFTYLKDSGVKKIFDVSIGADICIWAHVKLLKEKKPASIITQPCPAIVSYCKLYRHELLPCLSPVHSPMSCAALYMKKYLGIEGRIAALSPCIAKKNEFEDTGLADYNITFSMLLKYLSGKKNIFDSIETQFDQDGSGLGSLFPMPGGLKKNIEYFMGGGIHITEAEGFDVYEKLDKFSQVSQDVLPEIFDVLNCTGGCNMGPAHFNERNIFEIEKVMNETRKKATEESKREHYKSVYKLYDDTLDLRDFLREYKPVRSGFKGITDKDINRAFDLLGKNNYTKQNINCGACGSETCRNMARKIALNVNIPLNCIFKSMEDAKAEHSDNLHAREQLSEMEKVHEADELIRTMLDENPHINIIFDSKFRLIDCNPASVEFMGFSSKEEMLKGFYSRIKYNIPTMQADGRKSSSLPQQLLIAAREGSVKFETLVNLPGGPRSLDVEFKKIPYGRDFVIVGFVYDLTSISEREMELISEQEKNELQLTKLNAVVNATKIGLWDVTIVNNDPMNPGNVFIWSDEFRYMLGYKNEIDFPNTADSYYDKLHPEDREYAQLAILKHLQDKTGKTPYDVEYRLLCKNGEYAYFRACGEAIRDKNGNAVRVAGAVMDITESKKVLLDTQKQKREAESANRAKTAFLSNMSHEIRTPLNAIIGMTTIGKMAGNIEKKDEAFKKIDGASKHLLGVINDILDMSKIEANKLELSMVCFNFKDMLQKVNDIVSPRINERKQKFYINIENNMPQVLIGDDQRLTQVITNLVSNAVKFTPEEGFVRLDSGLLSENNGMCRIQVSVEDTGIGISDNQKERLFNSFEQADARTSRKFGGTGLGLPISKRIVELMDGKIWVESEPGKGSKFIFNVLLKRGDENDIKNSDSDQKNMINTAIDALKGKTIILAEDIEINREIVITLLEPMALNIVCAENGKAALELYKNSPGKYDLIFMDIQMPVMDGYEATRAIRAFEKGTENISNEKNASDNAGDSRKQIPIIAMTANVFREDVEKCLEEGMNGHIRKPIDLNEMINILIKHIGH